MLDVVKTENFKSPYDLNNSAGTASILENRGNKKLNLKKGGNNSNKNDMGSVLNPFFFIIFVNICFHIEGNVIEVRGDIPRNAPEFLFLFLRRCDTTMYLLQWLSVLDVWEVPSSSQNLGKFWYFYE